MQTTKLNALKSLASLATFRKLALMVALLAVTTALILISTTTQAQASNGAVPNLQLSSASPGVLTITWDTPDPAPSDYRVIWAKQDLDFLSYKNSNEANRGNEYPGGSERSITLTGLAKGETFKVQARARYTSGGENNGAWSGPWTDTITTRVQNDPPAAPTGLTASEVTHDSVSLSWTAPSRGTVTGYRVLRGADANSLSTMTDDTGSTSPEYTDSTVDAETTYHYAVLALSQDGNGVQSTTVSTTTPAEPRRQQENTNSVPTASNGTVATDEDTDHAFSAREFNYSDSDNDTLASVKITGLPAADRGTLTLDGTAINSADLPKTITKAELDDGKLKYTPPVDANGTGYASFKFKVNDGSADSTDAHTMTISVTAVNDPATGMPAISGDAEVGEILTASTGGIADPDGLPSSFTHQWKRFAADGTTFETNIGADSDTYTLTASELGKKVRVEVSFTDNEGSSEGPLVSAAYPSDATVEAPEEEVSPPGISIVVEAPSKTTVGSAGTVSADIAGFDVFPDPDGHEYTYRIDVLDSDGNDADVCEGNGMGEALRIFENKTAWVFVRRGATELREAQISDQCEIGSYTARASVSDSDSTLVVSAEAELEITPQPPAAPTGLTTQGVTHNSITLNWTDPEDTSIIGYRVLRGNEAGNLTAIADDTGSDSVEYTDSTVAAETAYFYAVLALSQNVDGAQSATVDVTTRAAPEPKNEKDKPPTNRVTRAAPTAPQNLTVVVASSSLTFSWDAPTDSGDSDIFKYVYTLTVTATGAEVVTTGNCFGLGGISELSLRLFMLTNGTEYTFSVRGCNANNEGAAATINGTPMLPPPPALVSATVNGNALVMTFDRALASASLTNDAFTVMRTRSGAEMPVTLTDRPRIRGSAVTLTLSSPLLSTDTNVKVSYTMPDTGSNNKIANRTGGRATESFPDQAVTNNTPNTVPGPPRNFTIVAGDAKAALTWDAPTTAGTTITHYQYRHAAGASVPTATAWQSTTSGFVTTAGITGLTNSTAYAFEVRAVNAIGNSTAATASGTPQANSPATGAVGIVGPTRVPGTVSWRGEFVDDSDGYNQAINAYADGRGGFEFQWLRVDGGTETVITGATSNKYTLTAADVGKKLKLRLGFEDDRGNAESITGAAFPTSGTILTTAACPTPAYTGGASQLWTSNMTLDLSNRFKYHGFHAGSSLGTLDDRTITTEYTINAFQQYKSGDTNEIRLELSHQIGTGEENQLTLYVCDTPLRFADATYSSTGHRYTWNNASNRVNLFEHGERILYVSRDQTAPTVASAYVAGTALTLTFTEDLAAAASLANSAFTVKKTPSGATEATVALSATAPVISGKTVTLTLATALVSTDGSVKVSYTKPTSGSNNKLVDAAANETGTFTDQTVTNNTATITSAATGAPAITPANAFRVPGVLTANKGTIADSNGLPEESTFTWQWVQVDGMTETDIVSATSQTYTLAAADVGKKIKVKASFTDTGTTPNAEGPLTSAAYPTTGSILPVATDCLPPASYPGGATQIWTGRVTIGQVKVLTDPLAIRGYLSQSTNLGFATIPATDAAGTLSNTTLAAGSQYTIKLTGVSKDSTTQIVNNTLLFATTPAMTAADRKQIALYICDQAFPFSDASALGIAWIWTNTGLDWNDQTERTLYISRDQTAPTVSSFDVTGTTVTLTFSEDLGAAASLANSAFTVRKTPPGGTETTVTLSGTPAISGRTVTLTLSAAPAATDSVAVTYTKPTSGTANRLVDRFGNEVADFNQVVAEVPGAPTGLSAAPNGTTGIDLSWTAPADDGSRVISGYKIEVSTDGGATWTLLVANTGSTDTTYAHSGLTAGSTRHYRVSAINTIGASATSNTANANTPNTADHRPTSSTSRVTATEDTAFTFSGSNFAFFDNDAGATLVSVKITALLEESRGTLALDGTAITSSALPRTVTKAELDAGKLIYTPPNNWNGHATFRFKVNDGSVDSASAYTMLVSVTSVNDLPTSSGKTVAIIKGDTHTFEADDFAFTDVDDRDTLVSVKITTLPKAGTLTLRGVAIAAADLPKTVTKNDLDRDRLRFVPADNASGANYASFKFKVNDGTDDSASAYTLRMSINKPATGLPTITGMVHVGATLTADTSGIKDEDGLGTFTYQWISNNGRTDTDIVDATGSTYELVEADERKTIKVKVSFTDKIGNKENLTSAATGRVATRPNRLPTGKPTITGTPRVGETLTASISDIADADGLPNTFRYRWKRFTLPGIFNANIGSNSNTHILTSSDIAMQVKLEVSYTDGRGAYETLISDAYPRRNGVEPAPTPSNDCAGHNHSSALNAPAHWHPCLELIRPVGKIPFNYDGDLTLGVEKTYTHGVTHIPSAQEADRPNVMEDAAIYRIRLEPGQKYRFTVRRDTIGGDSFGRYDFGIGHLQTTCVDIFGCDHHGGVEPIHLDKRTTNAPLVHPGALTSLTEKGMNYSQFFQEFQTPCLPGSPDTCGPALLNNYDYPHYYYAVVDPASGAAAGERVHLKVERLPSTHVLADSPLDDQYAWQMMGPDKDGKSGYVLNFIGVSIGMWDGATVSGYLDHSNDVDMHRTFRTANNLDCKITPAGHASGTPAKAATNLKIKTEDGLPRDSIDSVTLDPFSYVEVYSTTGDTGGYQITASECARNTTYYAVRGVEKRNHPTGFVVGRWLTAELEEPSSEAVTVTAEDDFDLIKFGREPGPSNWILKPGEKGLVKYNTNLHKITLNAGTSYNMKRRGDLRNDLAISIVSANDSCDDQRFISGGGDFIQYDAEDETDGSEFTPILHYSALNTRSDTDTDTGTSECYIIAVEHLHSHDQKFGPYSILVTENTEN